MEATPPSVPDVRARALHAATRWIGVLALSSAVGGALLYASTRMDVDLASLQLRSDDTNTPQGGENETEPAVEARRLLTNLPRYLLIGNLVLAAILTVLWRWAPRAPLAAIGCALAVLVAVQVVDARGRSRSHPQGPAAEGPRGRRAVAGNEGSTDSAHGRSSNGDVTSPIGGVLRLFVALLAM